VSENLRGDILLPFSSKERTTPSNSRGMRGSASAAEEAELGYVLLHVTSPFLSAGHNYSKTRGFASLYQEQAEGPAKISRGT